MKESDIKNSDLSSDSINSFPDIEILYPILDLDHDDLKQNDNYIHKRS